MRASLENRIRENNKQELDLAPLLDVVFILLIFFIVTTVFVKETGVEVDKPQAVSTKSLDRSVIMFAITNRREVIYDSTNIGTAAVRATVAHALRQRKQAVVIQADKNVPTELLIKVIDEAKLGGAEVVNIATNYN